MMSPGDLVQLRTFNPRSRLFDDRLRTVGLVIATDKVHIPMGEGTSACSRNCDFYFLRLIVLWPEAAVGVKMGTGPLQRVHQHVESELDAVD